MKKESIEHQLFFLKKLNNYLENINDLILLEYQELKKELSKDEN